MIVFRRRLVFWLIKAYIRKSGRTIIISFFLGLLIFLLLLAGLQHVTKILPNSKKQIVGIIGAYSSDTLPPGIEGRLSEGLTKVSKNGTIQPAIAESWEIGDLGKSYIFHLPKNTHFADGTLLTSDQIQYDFSDVKTERPDKYTITYTLRDAYSPFLVTVTRPIFKKGLIGISSERIKNIDLNGNFVKSMSISSVNNAKSSTEYRFYPSEDSLKTAFALGEVTEATGLKNDAFKQTSFSRFATVNVKKEIDYSLLVSIFFNTEDPVLSDKKMRTALSYSLPDSFIQGERTTVSIPPQSLYFDTELPERKKDLQHAKLLIDSALQSASASAAPTFTIMTLDKYEDVAKVIAKSWRDVGIKTKIQTVDKVPNSFQIYLGDFNIPRDPDQYTLWHSGQVNNITKFKNLRIDKLLEDGRKVSSVDERKKIYSEFQKYLLDETPASFLYFPYSYTITRQ